MTVIYNEISPQKYYSLSQVLKMRVIPWLNSMRSMREFIKNDIINNNNELLKVIIKGQKNGKRYLIKGEHLIALMIKIDAGEFKAT